MGIDLYVGTLARYYTRRWETAQQRFVREMGGLQATVVHAPGAFPLKGRSYGEAHSIVQRWRMELAKGVRRAGGEITGWKEDVGQPYFTEQLVFETWGALLLWAAYDERPDLMPAEIRARDWSEDPAFKALEVDSKYAPLFACAFWLPCTLTKPVLAYMPDQKEQVVCSLQALRGALDELNGRTWRMSGATREAWMAECAQCTSFESWARQGFDRADRQLRLAEEHVLPMVFDV